MGGGLASVERSPLKRGMFEGESSRDGVSKIECERGKDGEAAH